MTEIAAVILAAGRGTRYGTADGGSKVLAPFEGRSLLERVVATAAASRLVPIVVVVGAAADRVEASLRPIDAVTIIHNPDYRAGMAGSLRAGIAALSPSVVGAVVLLGDMPLVASATLDALVARFCRADVDAVVPVHDGRQGNPVLLGRSLFPRVAQLSGDHGARGILSEASCRLARCDVDDPGVLIDIDTPAALAALAPARREER